MADLHAGSKLTGKVTNIVHFGAFVDVGVENDGLLHNSNIDTAALAGRKTLCLGDRVECVVTNVDVQRKRLGLRLVKVL